MSVSHAQLKAFHAVAVHGSFTKAAERLFLTQPAISDQVRKLEERYGVLLFHRNKRSVRLTDLGERLLGVTQKLFVIEAEAQELLQDSQALQTGSLVLAVDAPVHALPQIARFCERYPGISVKIETGNTDESLLRLFNYQADLALLGRDVSDERLLSLPLRNDPMVAFVSRNHPWADRKSICLADLDDTPLVLREIGSVTRQTLEEEMAGAGFRIRPAIQVEGREAAREAVVVGIGVGVVSAAEFGADSRVCALPITDCKRRLTETLVCLREQSSRRVVATFPGNGAREPEVGRSGPHRGLSAWHQLKKRLDQTQIPAPFDAPHHVPVHQPLANDRHRRHPGVVAHLYRRHHAHAQLGGHRFSHRFATVQLQQHPWVDLGMGARLIKGAPGYRTRLTQHHDHLIQFLEWHAIGPLRPRMTVGHQCANV